MKKLYGVFAGRFQPCPHLGHEYTLDQIEEDKLEPIILIGSSNVSGTAKNPTLAYERVNMWKTIKPGIKVSTVADMPSYDDWYVNVTNTLLEFSHSLDDFIMYIHNKEEDRHDFKFNGTKYVNEFYSKIFEVSGLKTKNIVISTIPISGTKIRENIEEYKHFLRPSMYKLMKEKQYI